MKTIIVLTIFLPLMAFSQIKCDSILMSNKDYKTCLIEASAKTDSLVNKTYDRLIHTLDSMSGVLAFSIHSRTDTLIRKLNTVKEIKERTAFFHTYYLGYKDRMVNSLYLVNSDKHKRDCMILRQCISIAAAHQQILDTIYSEILKL